MLLRIAGKIDVEDGNAHVGENFARLGFELKLAVDKAEIESVNRRVEPSLKHVRKKDGNIL